MIRILAFEEDNRKSGEIIYKRQTKYQKSSKLFARRYKKLAGKREKANKRPEINQIVCQTI